MRARLALAYCNIKCELREVSLKAKPEEMLQLSPKGTVPVLYVENKNLILKQSLDIMLWALQQNKNQQWLPKEASSKQIIFDWIDKNDNEFKPWLDKYKYASRFPEKNQMHYFEQASVFLKLLEQNFRHNRYLGGKRVNLIDMAILPFIRQFASVDRIIFDAYFPKLAVWLDEFLNSPLFKKIMTKHMVWQHQQEIIFFPNPDF